MTDARRPYDDIRRALDPVPRGDEDEPSPTVRLDPNRAERTGVPEVILAGPKPLAEIVAALSRQAELAGRAIASRCSAEIIAALRSELGPRFEVEVHLDAHAVVVCGTGRSVPATGGRIAIICAGTSDRPAAAEAALIAREMGVAVDEIYDVGVAGLHRLIEPLERVITAGVDAIVVAAGMDGALPSVVAGLVPVPVIGLPTSVGYGFGGQGIGALTAMLQSCAPGLVVVNIDNGIGAGAAAALIANQAAGARSSSFLEHGLDQRPGR